MKLSDFKGLFKKSALELENSSESRAQCSKQKHALREQILDVATKLFADDGFHLTTIRKIAQKAHCNVAAVNYHFHGKNNLYEEVFRRQMKLLSEQRMNRIEQELFGPEFQMDIESLIRSFAEIFLEPFLTDRSGLQLMRLMMHERQDPHLPQDLFFSEVVQPTRNIMRQALIRVCPELSQTDADLCLYSIVAQLLNLLQTQVLFKRLDEKEMPILDKERSIEHIVNFSTGGIRQYLESKQ